jgi:hypothetical protein
MELFVSKTLKPFLVIFGVITMFPGMMTLSPEAGLLRGFQLKMVLEQTIMVQHWGLMIFLVGLLMVVSVFKPRLVFPVMLYAALQKAGMVILIVSHISQPWAAGFRQALVVDGICVFYAILYFYMDLKRTNNN